MSRLTGSETKNLVEAYYAIYARQEEVNEEFTQANLEVEIVEAVSYALISQGHTANDVLEYFANVDDEVIIEDLVGLSEGTLIVESVVSEEYIEEQMQQLDVPLLKPLDLHLRVLELDKEPCQQWVALVEQPKEFLSKEQRQVLL